VTGTKQTNTIISNQENSAQKKKKKQTNREKRQPIEWEKIFTNCTSDKRLITRICKALKNLNNKEQAIPLENGHYTQVDIS
jgi:hypothetical protein